MKPHLIARMLTQMVLAIGAFVPPLICQAVQITYTLASLGADNYRYGYVVTNDSAQDASPVQWFDLQFDTAFYGESSLTIITAPGTLLEWHQEVFNSAPGVPATVDVSTTGGGVAAGQSLGGFAVEFRWIGAGVPGSQAFDVFDPVSFGVLLSGSTVLAIPEPGSALLLLVGIVAVGARRLSAARAGGPVRAT